MQEPFARHLLSGKKQIETRLYDLPPGLIGRRVDILETRKGESRVPQLKGDTVEGEALKKVRRLGWVEFGRVVKYDERGMFEADEEKHLVTPDSGYGWTEGGVIFGWVVARRGMHGEGKWGLKDNGEVRLVRRLRSLFEVQDRAYQAGQSAKSKGKKNKGEGEGSAGDGLKAKKKRF